MSQTFSYTFYVPAYSTVEFPIRFVNLPAPQSQVFQQTQTTKQIQSTTDPSTALGLGTISSIKTTIVDQQGQVNYNHQLLLNMNGSQSGEDIPPKGVLALCFSLLNQTTVPKDASDYTKIIIPAGQNYITIPGTVVASLCSGAYFGAVGTWKLTHYSDPAILCEYNVLYTLPAN